MKESVRAQRRRNKCLREAAQWRITYQREAARWRKANRGDILALTNKLLAIGGIRLSPQPEPLLPLILSHGWLMVLPAILEPMEHNLCHQNILQLAADGEVDAWSLVMD